MRWPGPASRPPASVPAIAATAKIAVIIQFRARPPWADLAARASALWIAITTREVAAAAGMSKPRTRTDQGGDDDEAAADPEEPGDQPDAGGRRGDQQTMPRGPRLLRRVSRSLQRA